MWPLRAQPRDVGPYPQLLSNCLPVRTGTPSGSTAIPARPPVSLPTSAPTPVAAPSSPHCSWTATRPWKTSLASWATPGPPPPPVTSSASAVAPTPSPNGPPPSSTATTGRATTLPRGFGIIQAKLGATLGATAVHCPIRPNPMVDRSPRSEGISRTVVHRPGPLRGAGGNRTPVRRAVADRATTIPEIYGSTAAAPPGRWASRGGRRRVCSPMPAVFPAASGLSRRQSPLLLPGCGDQALRALTGRGCSRCAWRSGDEGVLLIGSCVCAPFKESEQLRSHDSASGPDVETDQPRWWYRLSSSFTILPAF